MDFKRPLFHRFLNREAVNLKASVGGKWYNDGKQSDVFTGEFAFNNPLGTYWPALVQTDDIVLSEGGDSEVGGNDYVKITANGDAITVPGAWKQMGATAIDNSNGAVNHIYINKTVEGIVYAVNVE